MPAAPNTEAIDQHLKGFIQALHVVVNRAVPHVQDDPKLVDRAVEDCKEILDVVLEGNVSEWLK